MSKTPGASVRYYGQPGRLATCGDAVGSYKGACRHYRKSEDPCAPCGNAARVYWRERRAEMRARPVETWPHGTRRCYVDFGCRREECRTAARNTRKRVNAARAALGLPGQ